MTLVCGHGFNDGKYKTWSNGKVVKEYNLWHGMLQRSYNEFYKNKNKTYTDCTVSDNFKNYSYFYEWCQKQVGFGEDGFELDKDLLVKGNKIYSENTCVFLPKEINQLLNKSVIKDRQYPVGVSFHHKSGYFVAYLKKYGKTINLGGFNNPGEAFNKYKEEKKNHAIELANKYRDVISNRAYIALINYQVNIND